DTDLPATSFSSKSGNFEPFTSSLWTFFDSSCFLMESRMSSAFLPSSVPGKSVLSCFTSSTPLSVLSSTSKYSCAFMNRTCATSSVFSSLCLASSTSNSFSSGCRSASPFLPSWSLALILVTRALRSSCTEVVSAAERPANETSRQDPAIRATSLFFIKEISSIYNDPIKAAQHRREAWRCQTNRTSGSAPSPWPSPLRRGEGIAVAGHPLQHARLLPPFRLTNQALLLVYSPVVQS